MRQDLAAAMPVKMQNRIASRAIFRRFFKLPNFPITNLQNSSKFNLHWLPVGRCSLKKLPLGKSEHPRQYVCREGLNLRVQIAYHRIVIAACILDLVFRLTERSLELREFLGSFELGIVLRYGEQALQRAGQLIIR